VFENRRKKNGNRERGAKALSLVVIVSIGKRVYCNHRDLRTGVRLFFPGRQHDNGEVADVEKHVVREILARPFRQQLFFNRHPPRCRDVGSGKATAQKTPMTTYVVVITWQFTRGGACSLDLLSLWVPGRGRNSER